MAWVKIDDQFYDHPRWADAPGDSIALWLAAMAWCNRNDSIDGFIPEPKTRGLVAIKNAPRTCADLCAREAFSTGDSHEPGRRNGVTVATRTPPRCPRHGAMIPDPERTT